MAKQKPVIKPEPKKDPEGPVPFKPVELSPKAPKFRFYCNACTGVAFFAHDKKPGPAIHCQSCGAVISTFPEENYIKI